MVVSGVDDAGRGAMLGPLVIAGVSASQSALEEMSEIGVRDSKRLSPKRRENLYGKIIDLAENYHIARIRPSVIDRSVFVHGLNRLEARYMARVICRLGDGPAYVDSCDVNPARFGSEISRLSGNDAVHASHHADDRFIVVSAASILAKVARDRSIARLRKKHDLGSGYPSDKRTVRFVRGYVAENGDVPVFARRSWKPVRRLLDS